MKMQMLMSRMRAAIEKYNMIDDGDKIAVGVSGGKDSLALLVALKNLQQFYPAKFDIVAISIDPQFHNKPCDYSAIESLCSDKNIPYIIKRTQLFDVVFNQRKEKSPCSLCAKMRRGLLHDAAVEEGCNKIALGHHLDDAVTTFYMNLLDGGSIGCFSPKSYLSRKNITMIRPMIFAYEKEVARAARSENLPIVQSDCPADGNTERARVRSFIDSLEKQNGFSAVYEKTLTAMQKANISGWGTNED